MVDLFWQMHFSANYEFFKQHWQMSLGTICEIRVSHCYRSLLWFLLLLNFGLVVRMRKPTSVWAKVKWYFLVLWSEVYYKDHKTEEWHCSDCKELLWFGALHLPHSGNITAFLKCFFFSFVTTIAMKIDCILLWPSLLILQGVFFDAMSLILSDLGWSVRKGLLLLTVTVFKFS